MPVIKARSIFIDENAEKPWIINIKKLDIKPTIPVIIAGMIGFLIHLFKTYLSKVFTTAQIKPANIEKNIHVVNIKMF